MRLVRVQVYAREKYRAANGQYDIRSVTLEAELESGDGDTATIWDLQKKADDALSSWIDLQNQNATPTLPPAPAPVEDPDDRIPF